MINPPDDHLPCPHCGYWKCRCAINEEADAWIDDQIANGMLIVKQDLVAKAAMIAQADLVAPIHPFDSSDGQLLTDEGASF